MNTLINLIENKTKFHEIRFKHTFMAKLDGAACKTSIDLYTELVNAFELPDYFGKNLDALYDCLMDLEWITQDDVVFIIDHFDQLLSEEHNDPELLEDFLVTLDDVCRTWDLLESDVLTPKTMRIYIHSSVKVKELLENNEIEYGII